MPVNPRALRSFTVRAHLPAALAPLHTIAMDLRWSWDARSRDLFRWVDPDSWDASRHDPVQLLGTVSKERLDALVTDAAFMEFLTEVHDELTRYHQTPRWFQRRESPLQSVAYFSPEFGISEALPQYSGGLGVLAGDHLKAASGLGVPVTGIGIFYREGYFRQELNQDGWQQERYVTLDPHAMPLTPVDDIKIEVDLAGVPLFARIWKAQVGRVELFLLDSDVEENDESGRAVTNRLYGGGEEHRIRQEILLGVGGVRALRALGRTPQVFHMNEGHAGFSALERIRALITENGLSFEESIEAVRSSTAFTTHTPVPAGIDLFSRDLMNRYFKSWSDECRVDMDTLMSLGQEEGAPPESAFNMAIMCLRTSGKANGVSELHGKVSRQMFANLWAGVPIDEVPISSVTNGVHARTWIAPGMADLFDRYVLPEWNEADHDRWDNILSARDDEIWRVRDHGREMLVAFVRRRLREAAAAQGASEIDLEWCESVLDPRVLTIGFARRFAEYKRPTLLLSQPERLKALLTSPDRPIQIVFAGKSHPADDIGKQMIRQIVQFSRDSAIRHRIAFIEDYDISVARALYQGADVWLNNPRRPLEACGTSGEKAALNGALNLSIRDGWWDEMFNGENGWAISSAETYEDIHQRDQVEAGSMFDLLERQVIPRFYDRMEGPVPRAWVRKIKSSLATLGPQVSASRMVRDYVEEIYEPLAQNSSTLLSPDLDRVRELAGWKQRVRDSWDGVQVVSVESESSVANLGSSRQVRAVVALGGLSREDVEVQLVHGPVGPNDELQYLTVSTMKRDGDDSGELRYEGSFSCDVAGRYGFAVRVVPSHPDLSSPAELGLITWA